MVGSALIVAFVIWRYPNQLVDLGGHGYLIGQCIWLLLIGLAFTHFVLLCIMWVQRGGLKASEAAMFRWIGEKAIFWSSVAYFYRPHDEGVPIRNLVMFVLIFVTTVDLDIKLFRRYILGVEDRAGHLQGKTP